MGYTTDFTGKWIFNMPLLPQHYAFLKAFSHIRHMKRDNAKLTNEQDPIRENAALPLGTEGEYFIGLPEDISAGFGYGQDNTKGVIDQNTPAGQLTGWQWDENRKLIESGQAQPGLWCNWTVEKEDGNFFLQWDEGEKFYDYIEWLQYLLNRFIIPWGYTLNGKVNWQGEESGDTGMIIVLNNVIKVVSLDDNLDKNETELLPAPVTYPKQVQEKAKPKKVAGPKVSKKKVQYVYNLFEKPFEQQPLGRTKDVFRGSTLDEEIAKKWDAKGGLYSYTTEPLIDSI